jgi:apolipoprotein D and lipocalin family protein
MKSYTLPIFLCLATLVGCKNHPPLRTVAQVDLERYAGLWYEVASFPARFQRGCTCTTAEYTPMDGYIRVENNCKREEGRSGITGKAFPVKGSGNARLKVQFFWPFRAPYYIIALADDYSWAVVGTPSRKYLWLLSRIPVIDNDLYFEMVQQAKALGFDTTKLVKTPQAECD